MQKFKRGNIRNDGKIFMFYVKGKEYWVTKEKFDFIRNRDAQKRKLWRKENPDLAKLKSREWFKKNPASRRNSALKRQYGLTAKDYSLLLKKQNQTCAICKNECKTERALSVDHCHKTKKIRGLLCGNCNRGIGMFLDSPFLLQEAIFYLEKNS